MTERSVKCPACPFSFAKLVDAGDFHAYVCPDCGSTELTTDRRPGNRPADVCALCDTPIDLRSVTAIEFWGVDYHLYVGEGWVHGGGREHIPVHHTCCWFRSIDDDTPSHAVAASRIRERLGATS